MYRRPPLEEHRYFKGLQTGGAGRRRGRGVGGRVKTCKDFKSMTRFKIEALLSRELMHVNK